MYLVKHTIKLLKKGMNFAITPETLPVKDIVTTTELACLKLKNQQKAQSLRAEIVCSIQTAKPPNQTSLEKKDLHCSILGKIKTS